MAQFRCQSPRDLGAATSDADAFFLDSSLKSASFRAIEIRDG